MISLTTSCDFSSLLSTIDAKNLLQRLNKLQSQEAHLINQSINIQTDTQLKKLASQWQYLAKRPSNQSPKELNQQHLTEFPLPANSSAEDNEQAMTDWLISLFDYLFSSKNVVLVRGAGEPEYFPAADDRPARIEFAHGFFASALHEISHFCMAGPQRRQLPDFGYWYAADGRSAAQQQAFERVEVKPQAIECLFTLACGRDFQVSQDNLFADFDTKDSTFAQDVYRQAQSYLAKPDTLPPDAQTLLQALLTVCALS
ncbi:elongation factor P hydroxylase [Psychrobacter sp.]|uniref:elongation factor P hydroxylase n=1 Tax=Psychrobacter sp. TaxID=56811 RepID=UPI003568A69F